MSSPRRKSGPDQRSALRAAKCQSLSTSPLWSSSLTLLTFCCLLLIGGCSHTPIVDYAVRNRAGRELNHVKITIGKEFEDEMGVLIPDAHSGPRRRTLPWEDCRESPSWAADMAA